MDSRASVSDVQFAPKHLGLLVVGLLFFFLSDRFLANYYLMVVSAEPPSLKLSLNQLL